MKTQQEQEQANIIRLQAYRNKQTAEQRQRAHLARRVDAYCKQLGLCMPLSSKPIKIALKQFESGVSEDLAYEFGINAARIMVIIGSNLQEAVISWRKARTVH